MSSNHHKIFESSECPAHQQLVDYLDGKLSAKEKHLVEEHLIDCEMCTDELEGLSMVDDRDMLDVIVEEIKGESLKKKGGIVMLFSRYRLLSSAAVLIILAAIVVVLQLTIDRKQDPLMAEHTESVHEKPKEKGVEKSEPIIAETKGIEEKGNERIEVMKEVEAPPPPHAVIEMEMAASGAMSTNEIKLLSDDVLIEEDVDAEVYIPAELAISEQDEPADGTYDSKDISTNELEEVVVVADKIEKKSISKSSVTRVHADEIKRLPGVTSEAVTSMQIMEVSTKGSRRSVKAEPMEKAMDKFNAEKYKAAAKFFDEIIISDSTNYKALYYSAYCNFELKNYEKAEHYLKNIVSDERNEYFLKAKELLEKIAP